MLLSHNFFYIIDRGGEIERGKGIIAGSVMKLREALMASRSLTHPICPMDWMSGISE